MGKKLELIFDNLSLFVTDKCNLRCAMCSEGTDKPGRTVMTKEIIKATLRPAKRVKSLNVLGGEPTMALRALDNLTTVIAQKKITVDEFGVYTNGVDLKKLNELCEILATGANIDRRYVMFSFDTFHMNAIEDIGLTPHELEYNYCKCNELWGDHITFLRGASGEIPRRYGRARQLAGSGIYTLKPLSNTRRKLKRTPEGGLKLFAVSPCGFERPNFVNPEELGRFTFGHVVRDGMEKIILNNLSTR